MRVGKASNMPGLCWPGYTSLEGSVLVEGLPLSLGCSSGSSLQVLLQGSLGQPVGTEGDRVILC